jgi:predicted RecB family nuclease
MAWYRLAVGAGLAGIARPIEADGTAGPIDRELADRILRYNEDDVLATLALRRWTTDRATEVPTVAELDSD